jgi:hypothetical protein
MSGNTCCLSCILARDESVRNVRFTLLREGGTDRRLVPIIEWALLRAGKVAVTPSVADFAFVRPRPANLREKAEAAALLFPCDILFVHRDSDGAGRAARVIEIREALSGMPKQPAVCVVPVREQETWLLVDESAIRRAAKNPNGKAPLGIPKINALEDVADPKKMLRDALHAASEATGRRWANFDLTDAIDRVPTFINDFSKLQSFPAFSEMLAELDATLLDLLGEELLDPNS